MQSSANVYQLLLSNDHVHVLQTFSSVNRVPAVKDWSAVSVPLPLYEKMVRKAVVKTVGQLQTLFRKPKMKPHEAELQKRQSCSSTSRTSTLTSNEHFFSLGKLERNIISRSSQIQHQATRVVDILCDECTEQKLKAVKSCLVCLTSYCEMHLKPHLTAAGLKRHQLLDPVENLKARICSEHNKPFELFCRTDNKTVCMFCILFNHKEHNYVPLSQEFELKRSELRGTEGVLKQMIQDRRAKLLDLRHTSKLNKEAAERQAADALQVIEDLKKILDQGLDELCKKIEMSKTEKEELTQGLIAELEKEIRVLMQSSSDVQQLSISEDDIHVLQTFFSVNIIPTMKNWSAVSVQLPSYEVMVKKAVESAEKKIQTTFGKAKNNLLEAEIQRAQGFKVNLTLDPQTADPWLILSKDCKQVRLGDIKKSLPGGPKRFNPGGGIVAKESFCSGRFFFEVQVTGMVRYDLGVVNESINRMNKITKSQEIGHWLLSLRRGSEYKARASHDIPLCVTPSPQRIGLFVDYDEGLVCFYGLDSKDLIYSFNGCRFTERLYPFFNPGKGSSSSASLKIS
ncbi:E3 ubiquitin-protein ligase TRIM21-like [Cyprinodon tularosa]|uniref:E3 ubiquitin-protein ligase TRIM21-like n=1 Tax=Cyprinodon tularosa TaxID=77115 RepID=UPI0018E22A51|nr:E3 ubiquitin-protein ligase TRIM21-like [Cyprinodon tularosa]